MMVPLRRATIMLLVLSLLSASILASLLLFIHVPTANVSLSLARKEFDREGGSTMKNLSSVTDGEKLPGGAIYKNENQTGSGNTGGKEHRISPNLNSTHREDKNWGAFSTRTSSETTTSSHSHSSVIIWKMEDQIIMAKTYLHFSSPNSNSHLVRELKIRIKEVERVLGRANNDSDVSRSDLQKIKAMDAILLQASKVYPDCAAVASKLRAQLYNAEQQLMAHQRQNTYLKHLTSVTLPKSFHCLCMRLTTEFFTLRPEEKELHNIQNVHKPDLYHYAVFSDNVLACAVVVNSTITTSMEPEKIVFHVITDRFNYPAMLMWFLLNTPGEATIQIQSIDDFAFLASGFSSKFIQPANADPRYASPLNHLRFYLPEIFPALNKILLLDHDVVVQRDLRLLWTLEMKGKVNGAVEACTEDKQSHLEMLVNMSDPVIANTFDADACGWAFGMNIFNLQEWRRQGLTEIYHKWIQLGKDGKLWKAGTLPLGQLLFYNHTVALDRLWHVSGLGRDSSVSRAEIERAAVVHYEGNMKPWLDTAIPRYRRYWTKFLDHTIHYLQQCNIHA